MAIEGTPKAPSKDTLAEKPIAINPAVTKNLQENNAYYKQIISKQLRETKRSGEKEIEEIKQI